MGSVERIRNVARRVAKWHAAGHQVVVVLSAMAAGETNRLLGLAREISPVPDGRELDMIAATGEQASSGLLAIALQPKAWPRAATLAGRCPCAPTRPTPRPASPRSTTRASAPTLTPAAWSS